jgi:hypothetical protein
MNILRSRLAGLVVTAALAALAAGCDNPHKGTSPARGGAGKAHAHDHPEKGPHDGALAEWGDEEYHAEFTVDHAQKRATVYVLDGTGKKAVPIAAESITLTLTDATPPVQVTLKADPQKDDPKGQSSRFSGTHPLLGEEREFKGEISGKVGDKPYAGEFSEKGHAGHKH